MAHDEPPPEWRVVATYRESDTTPKEEYFYHAAGDGGMGGSSYIDGVVLRDKDANTAWATTACDGVLEQRYYYLQNWRNDTVAMITSGGDQVEGDRYFAAGKSFGMFAGDMDGDGDVDAADTTAIQTVITGGGYDVLADMDRNGTVTTADKTTATTAIGTNLGIGVASASAVFNRKTYAGYECDPITSYEMYHVRHRVFNADLNRWNTRDPIGYVDGPDLYGYVRGNPQLLNDPFGLFTSCTLCKWLVKEYLRFEGSISCGALCTILGILMSSGGWSIPAGIFAGLACGYMCDLIKDAIAAAASSQGINPDFICRQLGYCPDPPAYVFPVQTGPNPDSCEQSVETQFQARIAICETNWGSGSNPSFWANNAACRDFNYQTCEMNATAWKMCAECQCRAQPGGCGDFCPAPTYSYADCSNSLQGAPPQSGGGSGPKMPNYGGCNKYR